MIESYLNWRKRRRAVREARLLLREARRGLRKYAHRLTDKAARAVRETIDALAEAAASGRDGEKLASALNALDKALDDHLSFARKGTVREYTESIAVAVLIALFLRAFVVEAFKIPSGSMIPTLEVGDHIFVNKFIYGIRLPWTRVKFGTAYRKPRRGEVVVFIYPKEPDKDFIKRIVALEGDTVEVRSNVVYVNGQPVPRRHIEEDCRYDDFDEPTGHWEVRHCDRFTETLDGNTYTTIYDRDGRETTFGPTKVGPGAVFVMGDNRDNSSDSRFWGSVPLEMILGKAMVIWWSSGNVDRVRLARMFHLVN